MVDNAQKKSGTTLSQKIEYSWQRQNEGTNITSPNGVYCDNEFSGYFPLGWTKKSNGFFSACETDR